MTEAQSYTNHRRIDPLHHLFAVPVLLLNFFVWIGISVVHHRHGLLLHLWIALVSLALLVAVVNSRINDLKVQDRVIRLEERFRYAALLSPPQLAASTRLTNSQIIALRFAADAELPALASRAVEEHLTSKQIKQSIVSWRADLNRV